MASPWDKDAGKLISKPNMQPPNAMIWVNHDLYPNPRPLPFPLSSKLPGYLARCPLRECSAYNMCWPATQGANVTALCSECFPMVSWRTEGKAAWLPTLRTNRQFPTRAVISNFSRPQTKNLASTLNKQTKPSKPSSKLAVNAPGWTLKLRTPPGDVGSPKAPNPLNHTDIYVLNQGTKLNGMPRRSTTHFAQNPFGYQKPEWAERATLREEAQFKSTFFFPSLCANCSHRNEITGAKLWEGQFDI